MRIVAHEAQGADGAHGSFERALPATTRSLAGLRRALRRWLEDVVDDPRRRADVVLAASELAAASVRAAAVPDGSVRVRAWADQGSVVVESLAEVPGATAAANHAFEGGDGERGFSIVAALSEVFALRDAPGGVVVKARVPSAGRFGTPPAG
jgi:anti-sigma regulatory factor (Ser/Thr protein kinase)